jgi:hypothetical protein
VVVPDGVYVEGVIVNAGVVVVIGELVGGRGNDGHAVLVGKIDGGPRGGRVVVAAHRRGDHRRARSHREDDAAGELVGVHDEAVAHPDGKHAAAWADSGVPDAVVRGGRRGRGDTGPVPEIGLVGGVVVSTGDAAVLTREEVVAGDVVRVTIAVVVAAVGEGENQVSGIQPSVAVAIRDPGVAGVVGDREDAVAVAIVRAGALGRRELAGVQVQLLRQVLVPPADAAVDDGDQNVVPADGPLPGTVEGESDRAELELFRMHLGTVDLGRNVAAELPAPPVAGVVRRTRSRVRAGRSRPTGPPRILAPGGLAREGRRRDAPDEQDGRHGHRRQTTKGDGVATHRRRDGGHGASARESSALESRRHESKRKAAVDPSEPGPGVGPRGYSRKTKKTIGLRLRTGRPGR